MRVKNKNLKQSILNPGANKPLSIPEEVNDVVVLPTRDYEDPWHSTETKKYVIKAGETLSSIARNLTGSAKNYRDLALAAGIKDVNNIKAGDTIEIPIEFLMNYSGYKPKKPVRKPIELSDDEIVIDDSDPNNILVDITPKVSRRAIKYRESSIPQQMLQYVPDEYFANDDAVEALGLPFGTLMPGFGYIQDNRSMRPNINSSRKKYTDENLNRALGRPDPFNLVRTYPELVKYQ